MHICTACILYYIWNTCLFLYGGWFNFLIDFSSIPHRFLFAGAAFPRTGGSHGPMGPLVIGYWLLFSGYWLLVIGYWLLLIGHWLLVTGYFLLVIGYS